MQVERYELIGTVIRKIKSSLCNLMIKALFEDLPNGKVGFYTNIFQ